MAGKVEEGVLIESLQAACGVSAQVCPVCSSSGVQAGQKNCTESKKLFCSGKVDIVEQLKVIIWLL